MLNRYPQTAEGRSSKWINLRVAVLHLKNKALRGTSKVKNLFSLCMLKTCQPHIDLLASITSIAWLLQTHIPSSRCLFREAASVELQKNKLQLILSIWCNLLQLYIVPQAYRICSSFCRMWVFLRDKTSFFPIIQELHEHCREFILHQSFLLPEGSSSSVKDSQRSEPTSTFGIVTLLCSIVVPCYREISLVQTLPFAQGPHNNRS